VVLKNGSGRTKGNGQRAKGKGILSRKRESKNPARATKLTAFHVIRKNQNHVVEVWNGADTPSVTGKVGAFCSKTRYLGLGRHGLRCPINPDAEVTKHLDGRLEFKTGFQNTRMIVMPYRA